MVNSGGVESMSDERYVAPKNVRKLLIVTIERYGGACIWSSRVLGLPF